MRMDEARCDRHAKRDAVAREKTEEMGRDSASGNKGSADEGVEEEGEKGEGDGSDRHPQSTILCLGMMDDKEPSARTKPSMDWLVVVNGEEGGMEG